MRKGRYVRSIGRKGYRGRNIDVTVRGLWVEGKRKNGGVTERKGEGWRENVGESEMGSVCSCFGFPYQLGDSPLWEFLFS